MSESDVIFGTRLITKKTSKIPEDTRTNGRKKLGQFETFVENCGVGQMRGGQFTIASVYGINEHLKASDCSILCILTYVTGFRLDSRTPRNINKYKAVLRLKVLEGLFPKSTCIKSVPTY